MLTGSFRPDGRWEYRKRRMIQAAASTCQPSGREATPNLPRQHRGAHRRGRAANRCRRSQFLSATICTGERRADQIRNVESTGYGNWGEGAVFRTRTTDNDASLSGSHCSGNLAFKNTSDSIDRLAGFSCLVQHLPGILLSIRRSRRPDLGEHLDVGPPQIRGETSATSLPRGQPHRRASR
eukprot:scaffold7146_cov32-Prasinocladus_malaysianus.AAC.1